MPQTLIKEIEKKSLRFGGISPVVLQELSGVYQPFVKAVKELISNAYDADAERVDIRFEDDFKTLVIKDYGCGMDPIEFVREYIRIGKGSKKSDFTSNGRPRIGGKGIGFLAPARYCKRLEVRTKKSEVNQSVIWIDVNGEKEVDVRKYLLQGHGHEELLNNIQVNEVRSSSGDLLDVQFIDDFTFVLEKPIESCQVAYGFDSTKIELSATINFDLLFSLESSMSLEEIENFCEIHIRTVDENEKGLSYTEITLHELKNHVQEELKVEKKKNARNVESYAGVDRFLWNLSRIIPVRAKTHENLPEQVFDLLHEKIDKHPIEVYCSMNGEPLTRLERFIIHPERKLDFGNDADLVKILDFEHEGIDANGFLIGQSSTIFPAECRGILLRVRGVAIGEPTYFGLDQILTGSAKVALSQISGEINIMSGIDAVDDINPGRDGFYRESKIYNAIKQSLIGEPGSVSGVIKEVIDAIITRSEVNASIGNFVKKYESQRKAILEASTAISELTFEDPSIIDQFFEAQYVNELSLTLGVPYKAEGKLATFTVNLTDDINGVYEIDFVKKELLLNNGADIWQRNINIGGTDFEIVFKQGKDKAIFCEVSPNTAKIFINWDHPMRGTMGDPGFIKHCLATIAAGLPQEQLNTYVRLVTSKI